MLQSFLKMSYLIGSGNSPGGLVWALILPYSHALQTLGERLALELAVSKSCNIHLQSVHCKNLLLTLEDGNGGLNSPLLF